jgi:tetratricopeptide (TPR) repeat protein
MAGRPGKARRKPSKNQAATQPVRNTAREFSHLWIYLALLIATFVVYSQVREFSFVDYDDPDYINTPQVRQGITREGLVWAFTSGEASNWFPVTRLSHMLDFQLFGARSGMHHLTSVLVHALTALLVFACLNRATGARWRSVLVAFLFALHPLHVESVAWVAERKDVLSAFFWFLTLWTYLRYAERPGVVRYVLVLLPFCLGLMSKPMIVTLPFVLLLVDVWPLRRPRTAALVWEKIPLLALAGVSAVVTFLVQKTGGAVELLIVRPIGMRIGNALLSYAAYIGQMFWPAKLALLYPYPGPLVEWQVLFAGLLIAGISFFVLRMYRDHPYLTVGWLWYLGTLVPVIGLVQVGLQAHADRYTYIPMVGLSIMLAWGAADLLVRWPRAKPVVIASVAVACSFAILITWVQIHVWKDSESVYRHTIDVTDENYVMHYGLGATLAKIPGRLPEAISEYRTSLRISPDYADAHFNLGVALSETPGHLSEAIQEYQAALRITPNKAEAHNDLGLALAETGRLQDAIAEYKEAIRIKPTHAGAHTNLGTALSKIPGRQQEAISEYETALRIDPASAEAHNDLGGELAMIPGHQQEAIAHYEAALRIKPDFMEAHYNLGEALATIPGRLPEAITHLEAAVRIRPEPAVRQMLDRLRAMAGSHG